MHTSECILKIHTVRRCSTCIRSGQKRRMCNVRDFPFYIFTRTHAIFSLSFDAPTCTIFFAHFRSEHCIYSFSSSSSTLRLSVIPRVVAEKSTNPFHLAPLFSNFRLHSLHTRTHATQCLTRANTLSSRLFTRFGIQRSSTSLARAHTNTPVSF